MEQSLAKSPRRTKAAEPEAEGDDLQEEAA
jgi:hypothetical protein